MRPHFRSTLLLLLCLGLGCACQREPAPTVRVGTLLWPAHEVFFLARHMGALPDSEVRLVEYSTMTQIKRSFESGAIDVAGMTLDMALSLEDAGLDPRVVLVLDISTGADGIFAGPGIDGVAGLRGRRVGLEEQGVSLYFLARALATEGLGPSDVQLVYLPIDQQVRAFEAGQLDAVVTFEPFSTRVQALGAKRIFDSAELPGEIVDVLVVRGDFLEAHPERVHQLRRGWFAALAQLRSNPGPSLRVMAERLDFTSADLQRSLSGMQLLGEEENRALLDPAEGEPGLLPLARRVGRHLEEQELVEQPIAPEALLPESLDVPARAQ